MQASACVQLLHRMRELFNVVHTAHIPPSVVAESMRPHVITAAGHIVVDGRAQRLNLSRCEHSAYDCDPIR